MSVVTYYYRYMYLVGETRKLCYSCFNSSAKNRYDDCLYNIGGYRLPTRCDVYGVGERNSVIKLWEF